MNKIAENNVDKTVVRMFSVSIPLNRDRERTRLDKSAACQLRKNAAGKCNRRVISAVWSVYSTLSFTRNTTRLRVICSIASPKAALNNRTATGNNCEVLPEGTTSLNTIFVTYGVNIVSNTTLTQAMKIAHKSALPRLCHAKRPKSINFNCLAGNGCVRQKASGLKILGLTCSLRPVLGLIKV